MLPWCRIQAKVSSQGLKNSKPYSKLAQLMQTAAVNSWCTEHEERLKEAFKNKDMELQKCFLLRCSAAQQAHVTIL